MSIIKCRKIETAWRARPLFQLIAYLTLMLSLAATATLYASHAGATGLTPGRTPVIGKQSLNLPQTNTPTSTPTSATPVARRSAVAPGSIPGQPQVDASTVALYHFDSPSETSAIDATGRYTGTLFGSATITNLGVYSGALRLDGASGYVSTGYLGALDQGTIEAFVDFSEACNSPNDVFPMISAIGPSGAVLSLQELSFGIYANNQWHWAHSGINGCRYLKSVNPNPYPWENVPVLWPYETWRFHHVAGTWGPRGIEIWVDGVLHGVGNEDPNASIWPYPYMCNPQDQESINVDRLPDGSYRYIPNPLYPACRTPVMAPTMPAYPPGDYTGALPTYNTFLIGYNPSIPPGTNSNPYFKGRIDEVRISNIQRTFNYTIVPTITPIPTQTPIPITGEYVPDATTAALYHLNAFVPCQYANCVLDEVTNQPKPTFGVIVPNGRFNNALAPNANGIDVEVGDANHSNQGTVEAWVKFSRGLGPQPIFSIARSSDDPFGALRLGSFANGNISFDIFDGVDYHTVDSSVTPTSLVGCWHHVAGTWGARGLEIWIDGVLRNVNAAYTGGMINSIYGGRVGTDYIGNSMSGMLDEVRISWVQRTFSPHAMVPRSNTNSNVSLPSAGGTPLFLPLIQVAPTPACPFGN